jgi:hypothetical protein
MTNKGGDNHPVHLHRHTFEVNSLISLHIMLAFKIVHRRGADRTPHCLALIKHREINDHRIEVVAQYFTSL